MKQIDESDYKNRLQKLGEEKWKSLKGEKNIFIKKRKTQDYLLQKGYEHDLINAFLSNQ